MHAGQLSIDVEVAQALIRDQFPQFSNAAIVELRTAGTVNAIFRIGSRHTARFPLLGADPVACKTMLAAEMAAMRELASVCPFRSPK